MSESNKPSKIVSIAGWILSIVPCLLLIMSAVMKFAKPEPVLTGFANFGYPERLIVGIGITELVCTIIYLIPQTAVLGAILLTGYLGGAIATHVRISEGFLMLPIFGVVLWLGLYLRDPRLRKLIPLRT